MSDGKKEVPEETYIPAGAHEEPGPDDIGPGDDDIGGDNDDDDGGDKVDHLSHDAVYADLMVDADKYGGDEEVVDVDGHEDISEIGFDEVDGTGTKGTDGKSFKGTVMHQIYRLAHLPPTLASYVLRDPVRVFVFESARVCTNVASEARLSTEVLVNCSLWQYIWKMASGYETMAKENSCHREWVSEFSRRLCRVW
jgi:hypothetical protein